MVAMVHSGNFKNSYMAISQGAQQRRAEHRAQVHGLGLSGKIVDEWVEMEWLGKGRCLIGVYFVFRWIWVRVSECVSVCAHVFQARVSMIATNDERKI